MLLPFCSARRMSFEVRQSCSILGKFQEVLVRKLKVDILTILRGNSILVLSCFFKASKYISECLPL